MHKSILTFGLLASSLVMLSAMPLFNNNSQQLLKNMTNTTIVTYSKYPTDDNKYECRTGPFEGFFVSSVEFCKHIKFDNNDNKDNKTGTQGPPGPAGPQGLQGERKALMELKAYKEFKVLLVLMEHKVRKEFKVYKALQVQLIYLPMSILEVRL